MPEVEWGSRGAEKVFRDNEKLTKSVRDTGDAYKDTMREAQELGRIAGRIAKDNETSQERFARQLVNAKRALDGGKISTEQLARETTRLTIEHLRSTDAIDKQDSATRKLVFEQARLRDSFGKVVEGQRMAFGSPAIARLAQFSSAAIAAIGAVGQATAAAEQRFAAAAGETIIAARAGSSLAIEAGGDPAKLARMRELARMTYREGAFATEGEARQLQAELASAGLQGDRAFFSRYAEVGDATAAARGVGKVRTVFGAGEAGSSAAILSKAAAVARSVPGADRLDVLQAVAGAGVPGQRLGLGDEAIFAAVGQVAAKTGSVSDAGKRVTALFKSLAARGVTGSDLPDILGRIGARGMSARQLSSTLGANAAGTFEMLRDTGALSAQTGAIEAAQRTGIVEQEVASQLALPDVAAGRFQRASHAAAQIAQESKALRTAALAAHREQKQAEMYSGMPAPAAWAADKFLYGGGFLGIPVPGISSFVPDALEARQLGNPTSMNASTERANAQRERQIQLMEQQNRMLERERRAAPPPGGRRE